MTRVDRERLLQTTDLLAVIEHDLGPAVRQSGRWYWFRCPFHNDGQERTPSLAVTPDNGRWKCFGGSCGAGGNVIDWVIRRQGLGEHDLVGAARSLGRLVEEVDLAPRRPVVAAEIVANEPPGDLWQVRAWKFVDYAKRTLWESAGEGALEYLHWRGLDDDTIRAFQLGYNPRELYDVPASWGFEDRRSVYLSLGIVIPCSIEHELWYVQIRRPCVQKDGSLDMLSVHLDGALPRFAPERKYMALRGSNTLALFGLDQVANGGASGEVLFLEEGEFNGMVLWQEAGDLVTVLSTGSASLRPESLWPWREHLLRARAVLIRFDPDAEDMAAAFGPALSRRFRQTQIPSEGDTNEFHQHGGNVRDWIQFELAKIAIEDEDGAR